MNRKTFRIALALSTLAAALCLQPAQALDLVVPQAQAAVDGNNDSAIPFGFPLPVRYQQVYHASQFGTEPVTITHIRFRRDQQSDTAGGPILLQVDLSTTSSAVDGLNNTFALNVGADNVTVFGAPGGAEILIDSPSSVPAPAVYPFEVVIPLTTPFTYDPSAGNLLMDVRNHSGGGMPLDAQGLDGDPADGVSSINSFFNGVDSPTADEDSSLGSIGLVTSFTLDSEEPVDTDGDGMTDDVDQVINSDKRYYVDVNLGEPNETSVVNISNAQGVWLQDVVNALAAAAASHDEYVTAIAAFADSLLADGVISKAQRKEMVKGAAQSNLGK